MLQKTLAAASFALFIGLAGFGIATQRIDSYKFDGPNVIVTVLDGTRQSAVCKSRMKKKTNNTSLEAYDCKIIRNEPRPLQLPV